MSLRFFRRVGSSTFVCLLALSAPAAFAQDPYHPSDETLKAMASGDSVTDGVTDSGITNGRPTAPRSNIDTSFQNQPGLPDTQGDTPNSKHPEVGGASSAPQIQGEAADKPLTLQSSSHASEAPAPHPSALLPANPPAETPRISSRLLKIGALALGLLGIAGFGFGYRYLARS